MTVIYLDLETTANGGPSMDSPEAHWSNNKVLMYGYAVDNGTVETTTDADRFEQILRWNSGATLVAHNAKFDIKYLMRDFPNVPWHTYKVWDTMTWEYLNSGHRHTMYSLEETAAEYNIKFTKSLDLGSILATGIKMENIPEQELKEYLEEDVRVLRDIAVRQSRIYMPFMNYILPLAEMELNGLRLDIPSAEAMAVELQGHINESHNYIRDYIIQNCTWQDGSSINLDDFTDLVAPKSKCIKPTANRSLSFLLTGEPKELKITPKWRVLLKGAPLLSPLQIQKIYQDIDPTHVGYPMDEETVDRINEELGNNIEMLEHLIRHRKGTKIVNTYIMPMLEQARIEGTVHPKLNTAITSTGRLSSSQPNGQNMPPEVRSLIRAVRGYKLEEVDYSQLELVGAAALSKCPALIGDLIKGVDIHYNTASQVFDEEHAEEKRKLAKNVNFGVLYGGKAYGLSKQTGVDKDIIQDLIDAFYTSYPGVAKWQRSFYEHVVDHMEAHDVKDGEQRYHSDVSIPMSGRKFRFIETEAPQWLRAKTKRRFSFSPNHTANYPIQGFAGGDIVMYGLYKLWQNCRDLYRWDQVQFLLTVHDSILLQVPVDYNMTAHYWYMCDEVKSRFNLPVPLHFDVESGVNWR